MTEELLSDWAPWTPPRQRVRLLRAPDGRLFRLTLAQPAGPPPAGGWPCLVVLDAERLFAAAAGAAGALEGRSEKTGVQSMVVAGLSHHESGGAAEDQRPLDFTSTPAPEPGWTRPSGGAERFRAFLVESVLPAVRGAARVDARRMTLFGHSLAGLFVLETMEQAPDLFARWISISPSLWWRQPDPAIASPDLLVGCGEAETARMMRARIDAWAQTGGRHGRARLLIAPRADHGSAPFALLPDALRHASGGERG